MKKYKAEFYRSIKGNEPAREWLDSLKNKVSLARILIRINRAEFGNFGDYKNLGDGVCELRIMHGPGYRVYYGISSSSEIIILLLCGDKSTQFRDIKKAKKYWKEYKVRK